MGQNVAVEDDRSATPDQDRSRPSSMARAWAFVRARWVQILVISSVLLIPCFWQKRIQAGDLSSHLYNVWLVTLIKAGQAPGLWLAQQWQNTLFDHGLLWLFNLWGPNVAARIAVALAVLVFFWSTFALVSALSGRTPWMLAPWLAVLTYGYVFQMGLFNFYVSLGLSFLVLALVYEGGGGDWAACVPLLVLASLAHPLPVAWVAGALLYVLIARQLPERLQVALMLAGVAALAALHKFLGRRFEVSWYWDQLVLVTGADQAWTFGRQYWLVGLVFLAVAALLLVRRWHEEHLRLPDIPFQLLLLSMAGVFLVPASIKFQGFALPLGVIPGRLSLITAALTCVVIAPKAKRIHAVVLATTAAAYFSFVYLDTRSLNRLENGVEALLIQLPPRQRVLALLHLPGPGHTDANVVTTTEKLIEDEVARRRWGARVLNKLLPGERVNSTEHILDRACICRCFSYANYEPVTGQFRVRVGSSSPLVLDDFWAARRGRYVVKEADLPVYQIYQCGAASTDLCIRALRAGEMNGAPAANDASH